MRHVLDQRKGKRWRFVLCGCPFLQDALRDFENSKFEKFDPRLRLDQKRCSNQHHALEMWQKNVAIAIVWDHPLSFAAVDASLARSMTPPNPIRFYAVRCVMEQEILRSFCTKRRTEQDWPAHVGSNGHLPAHNT